MKKTTKVSGFENGFKVVVLRKKRKGGILAESVDNKEIADKTSDTIKSESIDMEEKCLVEKTSVDYSESSTFMEGDPNQMPKSLCIKTKKVLEKPLVPVHKSFALDIDLVTIVGKSSQEKLNFVKKNFSGVNGFGGVFTPSKFGGIIQASFTFKKAMIVVAQLANDCGVVVNTDLKCLINNCINQAIVLKKISVGTSIEALVGLWQKAIIKLEDQNQADLLVAEWSILIGKDAVHVAWADVDKQTWDARDKFRALLYTLPMGTNAHNLWDFIGLVSGKTCVIECNSVSYVRARYVTVCFDSKGSLIQAMANTPVIKSVACYAAGVFSGPRSKRAPLLAQDQFHLAKIYEKKSAPVSCPLAFGGKTWASVVGSILSGTSLGYDFQLGSIGNSVPFPPVVNDLEKCLVTIESNLVSLVGQIGENIVMRVDSGNATSDKTAAVTGSTALPEVVKLENMLEGLSASVMSLSAHLDGLALVSDDVIHWHKDMNNLVSIFMESKLKGKIRPWLIDKFDGVRVFTSGLDSGSLGASVLIVVNFSLAKHVCKTGEINSLIAKVINESSFVILGGDFNEDSSRKCVSFKKCLELELVNSLIGNPAVKMSTWANFRGVMKTIDYVFVSQNLVNSLVHHGVLNVGKYFDTDHQAVSVSLGLGSLLNTHLFFFRKQANKDHWKFDVENASVAKWLEFKDTMAANTTMFLGAFGDAVKFSDLGTMWDVIHKIMVLSAGGVFKKRWFKGFDMVCNKESSRFYKLELLVFKLVKASRSSSSVSFVLLLDTWNNFNSTGASTVRSMFFFGAKFNDICSVLAKARRLYHSSKLLEAKCAEESHIRQAITNRMESFKLDKGHTIRSVLECLFHKVVLDHLVVGDELVLEPDLVKFKMDAIMEGWTRKHMMVDDISDTWSCQYQSLDYVFDDVFSEVISKINFDELHCVITGFPDGKAAGLSGISNELWKHCDKSVLGLLLVLLNSCLSCELVPGSWKEAWVSMIPKPYESSYTESQAGLSTFLAAKAFVNDTIWVGSSQATIQHILNVAILHPIIGYRTQFGYIPVGVYNNVSNNFLAGMVRILLDCNLSLGGSLASAFQFRDGIPMSVILGESLFFKFLPSLQHYGIAFVNQLRDCHGIVFSCFSFVFHSLIDVECLLVYTDSSLKHLSMVDCRAGAAAFFEDIDLGAIMLALECISVARSVKLFSDSQVALDAYRSELSLICPDFCNQCWVEHWHIRNVIHSKNLKVSWHKVKSHSSVLGNDCADSITNTVSLSGWFLPPCVDKHFLLVDGGVVSGNSRHFVRDVYCVFLSTCALDLLVFLALYKGFVFNEWLQEATAVFHNPKIAGVKITDFVHSLCSAFKNEIWLVCAKHRAFMEKNGLIPADGSISIPVFGSVLRLLSGVVKLFGVTEAFGWIQEAISIFHDSKVTDIKIADFVHSFCIAFRNNIWLVRAKYHAYIKKNGLIPVDGLISISVSGLVLRFSDGVVKLLGIVEAFGVHFGFHKSCSFFSGIDDLVSVNIIV
ncbi:hypothetical protein G9A89_021392 [Geosiphon pyriformis]|nr:hypothetical protein G9A89_021392 [Geosiphon pyriformis]